MSMENSNDSIGNQTRDLSACSAVPQPSALLRALHSIYLFSSSFSSYLTLNSHSEGISFYRKSSAITCISQWGGATQHTPFPAHKAYLNFGKAVTWSPIIICGCGPRMIHFICSPSSRSLDSNCWSSNLTDSRFVSSLSEANTSYLTSPRRIQAVSIITEGFPTIVSITTEGFPTIVSITTEGFPAIVSITAEGFPTISRPV